jgi:hypothetical protein
MKLKKSPADWIILTVSVLLLSACGVLGSGADSLRSPQSFGEETRRAWCEALIENTPSAGPGDTEQTIEDVADIGEVIWILCQDYVDP